MPNSKKGGFRSGKGKRQPFEVSSVAWVDLLGYGAMLRDARFDPRDVSAQHAVERLKVFHETVASRVERNFPLMILNDGVAGFRDLSLRSRVVTFEFLESAVSLHHTINEKDLRNGFAGARMIIAVGFRMREYVYSGVDEGKRANIFKRVSDGKITMTEAIHEAFSHNRRVGIVRELQANFAFTRAYLADQDGSKAGLTGPSCFIDLSVFAEELPEWITFEEIVDWSTEGMNAQFGRLKQLNSVRAEELRYKGVLDSFEVAERLASRK